MCARTKRPYRALSDAHGFELTWANGTQRAETFLRRQRKKLCILLPFVMPDTQKSPSESKRTYKRSKVIYEMDTADSKRSRNQLWMESQMVDVRRQVAGNLEAGFSDHSIF